MVALRFDEDRVNQAAVYRCFFEAGVAFELVAGGIEAIQGRHFAQLTLALDGPDAAVRDALAQVSELVKAEVL
ncbi:MAG: hypothetical protein LBH11_05245 [Propionibacteriaceae bacterium]|nr:hypothetical protein [Propionibacteriaceae bacterium]